MLTAVIPVVFMLAGALVYVLASNSFVKELGRILFAAGSFALAFALAGRSLAI